MARSVDSIVKDTLNSPELSEQIDTLRNDLGELSKTVSSLLSTGSSVVGARLSEGVSAATAQAQSSLGAARERTRDASQATLDTVIEEAKRNPVRTLALTLGAGLLLGLWAKA